MLVAVLVMLFVPLSRSFVQVRDEARSRAAVREALRLMGPADAFVTQQVDITTAQIVVRLVAASPVSRDRIGEAQKLPASPNGKEVSLAVRKVASEEELALTTAAVEDRSSRASSSPGSGIPPSGRHGTPGSSVEGDVAGRCRRVAGVRNRIHA